MIQRRHFLKAAAIWVFMSGLLCAQPALGRREVNQPILLVDSESPTSNVFALRFVPDSAGGLRLLAGGEGKVIGQWQVRSDHSSKAVHLDSLARIRWPIDRGLRGMISSIANGHSQTEASSQLAFGGFGALPTAVQLQKLDRAGAVQAFHSVETPAIQHGVFSLEYWPEPAKLLAVGCGGAEPNQGLILIWNLEQSERPCEILKTGFDAVTAIRVSPNGRTLVAADRAGKRVRQWTIRETNPFRVETPVDVLLPSQIVGLEWLDDEHCVAATISHGLVPLEGKVSEKSDPMTVRLILRNRTARPLMIATRTDGRNVNTWEIAPDRCRVETTSAVQQIAIRDAMTDWQTADLDLRASPRWELDVQADAKGRPKVLAFAGMSLFAAANGVEVAYKSGLSLDPSAADFGKVRRCLDASHMDLERPLLARLQESLFDGPVTAVAVSPDGQFVAAAGEQTRPTQGGFGPQPIPEIRLWRVSDGSLAAVIPDRATVLMSLSPIRSVGLSRSQPKSSVPDVVQFSWSNEARAKLSLSETLNGQAISVRANAAQESPANRAVQTWGLRQDKDRYWLTSQSAQRPEVGPFPQLDWFSSEVWQAHRFTRQKRDYMAIGYRDGILVWDLERLQKTATGSVQQQEQAIVRSFFGHTGRLSCISASEEGDCLITGALDGSICLWSLKGIEQPYDGTRELGLTLKRDASGTRVEQVTRGLPAFFAGLQPQDELEKLYLPRPGRPEAEWIVPANQWEAALKRVPPGLEARFQVRDRPGLMIAGLFHEPLWTLYPMLDGQWVMVTPSQIFGASSDEAMRRFGWHVNLGQGRENQVAFFPLDLFREAYDNIVPIVQTAWKEQRPAVRSTSFEIPTLVEITDVVTANGERKSIVNELSEPVDLAVNLRVQPSGREIPQELELWCNGRLIQHVELDSSAAKTEATTTAAKTEVAKADAKFSWTVQKSLLRVGDHNTLIAVVRSSAGEPPVKLVNRAIRTISVAEPAVPKLPKMHFLGVGVTDLKHAAAFQQSSDSIKPLQYAANDVCLLGLVLAERARASGFERGEFRYLVSQVPEGLAIDAAQAALPTHQEILSALDRLGEIAAPNDFVCLSISCHGFGEKEGAYLVAHDTSPDFLNAVTDRELFQDRLWKLKCPALVLLDACHSGSALTGDSLRGLNGFGLGPEILVSCKPQQQSFETKRLHRFGDRWFGMSVFTASLVEALTGQELKGTEATTQQMQDIAYRPQIDRNGDGYLSVEELGLHASRRVPVLKQLTKDATSNSSAAENPQQPDLLPSLAFPRHHIRLRIPNSH